MSSAAYKVLFICPGDASRSVLAEALMNELSHGRFRACSAPVRPTDRLHRLAFETLKHFKIPSNGLQGTGWTVLTRPEQARFDFVLTVCDCAAGEVCPVWPQQPETARWNVPDPACGAVARDSLERAFIDTAIALRRRIQHMLTLRDEDLSALAIDRRLR